MLQQLRRFRDVIRVAIRTASLGSVDARTRGIQPPGTTPDNVTAWIPFRASFSYCSTTYKMATALAKSPILLGNCLIVEGIKFTRNHTCICKHPCVQNVYTTTYSSAKLAAGAFRGGACSAGSGQCLDYDR